MPTKEKQNGSNAALTDALLNYVKRSSSRSEKHVTFQFGAYGGKILYANQPRLSDLVQNYELLFGTVPILAKEKRPTVVKQCFLDAKKKHDVFNLNNSSYPDSLWAGWCQSSLMLLMEHLSRCAKQSNVYDKVTKGGKADEVQQFDKLIDMVGRTAGVGDIAVKQEIDSVVDYHVEQPVTPQKRPPSSCSSMDTSATKQLWIQRSDYENWTGGSLMLAALSGIDSKCERVGIKHDGGAFDALRNARKVGHVTANPGARKLAAKEAKGTTRVKKVMKAMKTSMKTTTARTTARKPAMKAMKKQTVSPTVKPESIYVDGVGRLSVVEKPNGEMYITSHFAKNKSGRERWVTVTKAQAARVGKRPMHVISSVLNEIEAKKLSKKGTQNVHKKLVNS
jgi:hypothetical protein